MSQQDKIEAVHRAQSYIEEHLGEPITLAQLARAARHSPWHTARIFKEITGKSPFEYIRVYRLSQAATRLGAGHDKIIDVAFDHVFDSHEGFTKAFSRRFGMSPSEFRRKRPRAKLFLPPSARELTISREQGAQYMASRPMQSPSERAQANTVFIQVVERPERKVVLKRGTNAKDYYDYCSEVGCDVWDVLATVEGSIHEPMGMWLPENLRVCGTSEYVQGVEVPRDYAGPIPEGFDAIDLPACKIMIFQGAPFDDDDFEEEIGKLRRAIAEHDPRVNGFEWALPDAPRFQLIPLGYRGYIEGRPVRPLGEVGAET